MLASPRSHAKTISTGSFSVAGTSINRATRSLERFRQSRPAAQPGPLRLHGPARWSGAASLRRTRKRLHGPVTSGSAITLKRGRLHLVINSSSDCNGSHIELRLGAERGSLRFRSAEVRRRHCGEAIYCFAGPERRLAEDRQTGENLQRSRVRNTRQGRSRRNCHPHRRRRYFAAVPTSCRQGRAIGSEVAARPHRQSVAISAA